MTEATVQTITEMLRPKGDPLPQGFDHLANGNGGRTISQKETTQHLRLRGRVRAKDVAGWGSGHLCVVLGHHDLGKELANFLNHFIQRKLCEGTQRLRAASGHAHERGNQGQATTVGLRGNVAQNCLRYSRTAGSRGTSGRQS